MFSDNRRIEIHIARLIAGCAIVFLAAACSKEPAAPEATVAAIAERYTTETQAYEVAFDAFQRSGGVGQEYTHPLTALAGYLKTAMRSADKATREAAAVHLLPLTDYGVAMSTADYEEVAGTVSPESAAWKANDLPDPIRYEAQGLPPDKARAFLAAIIAGNKDRAIQGAALIALAKLERHERDPDYPATYAKLAAYKDIEQLRFDIALLNPAIKTALDKDAAPFSLPEIGGRGPEPFSSATLAGKYYILDFWATWCGPCLGERAVLERAYRHFKGANFTIVSVSLDKSPDDVTRYRQTRWAMPWTHVFLTGGMESQTSKDYDVSWIGLPHLLLVSPEGKIVALRDQLERGVLEKTLAAYLTPHN